MAGTTRQRGGGSAACTTPSSVIRGLDPRDPASRETSAEAQSAGWPIKSGHDGTDRS